MSDYSPPYTEEDARFDNRVEKLKKCIRVLPIAGITVGQMLDIIAVMQPQGSYHHFNKSDVQTLEKILG